MTQTSSRFFDEIARLMTDAAGVASGVRKEVDSVVRNQAEKVLNDLDVVSREEFDAVKEMAQKARMENEALTKRIATLEAATSTTASPAPKKRAPARKPAVKKPAAKRTKPASEAN